MSAHVVIALFLLLVFVCLSLFLALLLRPDHATAERESEIRESVVGLSAANAQHLQLLFGDADYRQLRARAELKAVCAKFRRDRRRIALLWLGELQRDVRLVWEFRRFLVRNGLPVTFREEVAIGCGGCFALAYLNSVRLTVFLCGPFVLSSGVQSAKLPVARLSQRGAGLLARAPAPMRAQLEQKWSQHVLAWNIG
ncbi:MAG: hypothetical protein ACRD4R_14860 [Candidatus Acidiferrales bacterium]